MSSGITVGTLGECGGDGLSLWRKNGGGGDIATWQRHSLPLVPGGVASHVGTARLFNKCDAVSSGAGSGNTTRYWFCCGIPCVLGTVVVIEGWLVF